MTAMETNFRRQRRILEPQIPGFRDRSDASAHAFTQGPGRWRWGAVGRSVAGLRCKGKLHAHPLSNRLLFGRGHAGERRQVGVRDFEGKSCRCQVADEGGEGSARQGAHEFRGCAELVGKVLGLVVAVGHADGAVREGIEHIGAGDLCAALVSHDHRDLLAAAFVEDR